MQQIVDYTKKYLKKNIPDIKPGDTVKVHLKVIEGKKVRTQIFEGLVLKMQHGKGVDGSFTVRKLSSGVGVERTFPIHSPIIIKVEKTKSAKVRQAKLYYMRTRTGKLWRIKGEKRDLASWEEEQEKEVKAQAAEVGDVTEDSSEEVIEEGEINEETTNETKGESGGESSDELPTK